MAFVFRSENKSSFLPPQPIKQQKPNEQNHDQSEKKGAICKGLPYQLQRQQKGVQKENCLPEIQANPIHSVSTLGMNATVFKSREFNDSKISNHVSADESAIKQTLTVKEILQRKVHQTPLISEQKLKNMRNIVENKTAKTLNRIVEEKPTVINKNLLKTMLHMSEKFKEEGEMDRIAIDQSKQVDSLIRKNKFKGWKSLKKLSPLKDYRDYSKFSQTAETDDINLSCGGLNPFKQGQSKIVQKMESKMMLKTKEAIKSKGESSEEEEEQQFLPEATPGPGAYSYEHINSKKQFRSKRKKFQKIFYSQIERFQNQGKKFQQVTYINDDASQKDTLNKRSSICQSFLSKSPKFKQTQDCVNPPPGYYDTRQTLEHDLVRHILKSSNTTTFINRSPRQLDVQGSDLPGPGSYMLDRSLEKLIEQKDKLSYSYKSQLERKLDYCPSKEEAKKQKGIIDGKNEAVGNAIHVKEDAILENYYISEPPPFMSTTERFLDIKMPICSQKYYPKNREIIAIPSPPKEPFNSSQKRETMKKVGDGVGIGLYNLNKDTWSKKSFNVLFN